MIRKISVKIFQNQTCNFQIWRNHLRTKVLKVTLKGVNFLRMLIKERMEESVSISVTRWLVYFFTILQFSTLRICPIAYKIGQSKLETLPNTKLTHSKCLKFFNVEVKWRNFAKSGHLDSQPLYLYLLFFKTVDSKQCSI